ncbi:MAG: hypothetical protein ACI9J3_000817 [Parvicellaceae bacterium]
MAAVCHSPILPQVESGTITVHVDPSAKGSINIFKLNNSGGYPGSVESGGKAYFDGKKGQSGQSGNSGQSGQDGQFGPATQVKYEAVNF